VGVGPVPDSSRWRPIKGPQEGGFWKGDGEAEGWGELVEAIKEGGGLAERTDGCDVVNVGRDGEFSKAPRGLLQRRLKSEAE
jgi:hypothetical protein